MYTDISQEVKLHTWNCPHSKSVTKVKVKYVVCVQELLGVANGTTRKKTYKWNQVIYETLTFVVKRVLIGYFNE